MRRVLRLISIIAIVCAIAGAYNVYSDQAPLEKNARDLACSHAAPNCKAKLLRLSRSPLKQTFVYTTGTAHVQIDCTRSLGLFGPYRCERQPAITFKAAS